MKTSMKLAFLPAMMLVIGLLTCIQKSHAGEKYSIGPYDSPGTEVGNTDKIKVLIVTGGHPFDREEFFALFQGYDDIQYEEFELKDESEVFEDISTLDYDVMVLYHMTQEISQKRRDNFVRLLKEQGIGLVVVHHAEAAYQSWLEYHQIIGTAYIYTDVEIDGKLWLPHCTNKIGMDIPVYVRDNKHPITRGMKNFHIKEETYKGRWWAKDNHLLLTTDHPDNDEPLAWTRQYGRSRVFNVQFGHDKEGFASPEFRELIVRGIRWTAGVRQSSNFSTRNTGPKSSSADGKMLQTNSSETVKDADGNIYHIVKIGNQLWTVENLRTTRYNDGTPIPNVTDDEGWKSLTTPGYCYYENNPENGKKYGVLYNWYAASSDKIAPKGWRVPTHADQIALRDYLIANGYNYDGTTEENKVAKSMAAKTDWIYKATNEGGGPVSDIGTVGNNPETNNRSGFSALPAGSRWNDGSFHAIGTSVYWWSTTPDTSIIKAHMSSVHTWYAKYGNNQHHKRSGFCIRLVRDLDNKEDKKDGSNLSTPDNTGTMNARSPLVAISTDRRAPEGVVDLYMRADNDNTLVSHHRTSLVAFDNVWHHIAWVHDRGNPRLYVDGVADTNSCTYTHQPITPTLTALGGVMREDSVRFAFQGLIDEAAVWSRALSDAEVIFVINTGFPNLTPEITKN